MSNRRELVVRGAVFFVLALMLVLGYMLRERTKDRGNSGILEQTVWVSSGISAVRMDYVVFRENTFEISNDGIMQYQGTYSVDEEEKTISFVFSLRPEQSEIRRNEKTVYELSNNKLEISFREEKWELEMTINLEKRDKINNRYWRCVEGDYKDYYLYLNANDAYVIDNEAMHLISCFHARYREQMELEGALINDIVERYALDYEVKDKKLFLSDEHGKSVFELAEEDKKRGEEILREAEKAKDSVDEMLRTSLWTARMGDKDYQMCFVPAGEFMDYYIYCLQDETILSEGSVECGLEGNIYFNNVQYYQNMRRAYEDIRVEVSENTLKVDFDNVTEVMDKDIFRENYRDVSYKETSRKQILQQAVFEKQSMEEGYPQLFSQWCSNVDMFDLNYVDTEYVMYEQADMDDWTEEEGTEYKSYNFHLWISGQNMSVGISSEEGFPVFDGALYGDGYIVDMDESKIKVCFYSSRSSEGVQKKLRRKGVIGTISYHMDNADTVTLEIGEDKIEFTLQ